MEEWPSAAPCGGETCCVRCADHAGVELASAWALEPAFVQFGTLARAPIDDNGILSATQNAALKARLVFADNVVFD